MMSSSVYLVVEPIGIIATDLAMNVQEYDPSATVLIALAHAAAWGALQGYANVRLAFVNADPSEFTTTNLARALDERRAKVIFTGDAAERNDSGVLVLHRPFSAETTAALLQRAERSETA
jgi:hypothetical protein